MAARRAFTVKEKAEIISKLKNGENNVDLCKEYKVSHSTISTMWKNRDKILECFESNSLKIKKNRKPTHQDVGNALLVWCKAQRSQNVPLSGRLLQEKANNFARLFGKMDFECSESWIYRFRQRHEIVVGKVCGEAASVSQSDCDNLLKTVFPKLTEDNNIQIWNADETAADSKEKNVDIEDEVEIKAELIENNDDSIENTYEMLAEDFVADIETDDTDPIKTEGSQEVGVTPLGNSQNQTNKKQILLKDFDTDDTEICNKAPKGIPEDPDLLFLYSLLPDIKEMSKDQKRRFKIKVLQVTNDILLEK